MAPALEVRLGSEFGRLVDISATGARVRTATPLSAGREYELILNTPHLPARLMVRVVWAEPLRNEDPVDLPLANDYLVGVRFTAMPPLARQVVSRLCGTAFGAREE
ncbi:MAG: PilZ domain-containing protein [Acidobacteriia bacterium]|nr:PilZ domain-containing protein [Terriglobia bacterium]